MDRELTQALIVHGLAIVGLLSTLAVLVAMWWVAPAWFCCTAIVPLGWSLFACAFARDGMGGG